MESVTNSNPLDSTLFSIEKLLKSINKTSKKTHDVLKNIFSENNDISKNIISSGNNIALILDNGFKSFIIESFNKTNLLLTNIVKKLSKTGNQYNVENGEFRGIDARSIDTSTKNQINIFTKDFSFRYIFATNKLLENLTEFFKTPISNFQGINDQLNTFSERLKNIGETSKTAATYLLLFTGTVALLGFVNFVAMIKASIGLIMMGQSIGLSLTTIMKAFAKYGIAKTLALLWGLPDLLESLAKSALITAASLYIMNYTSFSGILKLGIAILMLAGISRILSEQESKFSTSFLLSTIAFALLTMIPALKLLEYIKWESIGKLVAFITGLGIAFKFGDFNKKGSVMLLLGLGLMILTISFSLLDKFNWQNILMTNLFILGLGISLKSWNNTSSTKIIGIAFGLIMLVFSLELLTDVSGQAVIISLGILTALGLAIKFLVKQGITSNSNVAFNMETNGLGKLALGLMGIALAIYLFSNVDWSGTLKALAFMGALVIALKLLGLNKKTSVANPNKKSGGGMGLTGIIGFAFSLVILLLTIDAFTEIDWLPMFKLIVFMTAVGLITKLFSGRKSGLFGFALGMAILLLTIDAFTEIDWKIAGVFLVFATAVAFITRLFNWKNTLAMLGAFTALLFANYVISKVNTNLSDLPRLTIFLFTIIGFGIGLSLLGKMFASVVKGSLALIISSASLMLFATGINMLPTFSETLDKGIGFVTFMGIFSLVIFGLSFLMPLLIPAVLVAGTLLIISVSIYLTTEILSQINDLQIDYLKITDFTIAIKTLLNGLNDISIISIGEAVLKAVAMIPITISMFLAGITLGMISKLDVKPERIHSFGRGLTLLIDRINDIGGWNLAKTALKSALLLPIIGVSFLSALALKGISALDIKPEKMLSFGDMLKNIIGTITEIVSEYKDILNDDKIIKGVEGISKIISTVGGVAGAVEALANMRFNEYEVRNGQLVLKSSRPINDSDIRRVAQNVGTLIEGLINPIKILGANFASDKIDFMGKKIDNPFVSSDFEKGVDALAKISGAFKPIVDSISKYFESPLMKEDGMVLKFTNSVWDIVKMFIGVFNTLGKQDFDIKLITNTTTKFSEFIDLFEKFKDDKLSKMEISINKFVNALSDEDKWRKINTNIKNLSKELWSISKAINNISIEKATKLNNILYNMSDKNNSQVLREILEALYGIIDKITTTENNENSNTVQPINNTTSGSSFTNPLKQAISGNKNIQENNDNLLSKILEILQNLDIPKPPTVQKVHVVSSDSRGVY